MKALFVIDPIEKIDVYHDTTYVMMREAERRGLQVLACQVSDLTRIGTKTHATATPVVVESGLTLGPQRTIEFDALDLVFMRKDPPFDIDYIFATYLLDGVDPSRTWVINRPEGLREANEKCFILDYPDLIPTTIVTMQPGEIRAFLSENEGRCIIKPLDGMGGKGIFLLREDDQNLSSERGGQTHHRYRWGTGRRRTSCSRNG